jgi:DNA-binding MarR family transcriptional regulator
LSKINIDENEAIRQKLIGALLRTSKVLVAIATKSLAETSNEVTLAQYRSMVVLSECGSATVVKLSDAVGVTPPTATRMCDRLLKKGLISREVSKDDRREMNLQLTDQGKELIDRVTEGRRAAMNELLAKLPASDYEDLAEVFSRFADSIGNAPEQDWTTGWKV